MELWVSWGPVWDVCWWKAHILIIVKIYFKLIIFKLIIFKI